MARRTDDRVTLHDAAERLGVHYMTAYRYVRMGRLDAVQEDGRWWVRQRDIDGFARRSPAAEAGRGRTSFGRQRERLQRRLLAGDEAGAWAVLETARAAGARGRDVYVQLLAPVMRKIGDDWSEGAIEVADEHLATVTVQRLLGRLSQQLGPRGRRRGTLVLGVVPGDTHALPVGLLAGVARAEGYDVLDLGADTPVESFAHMVRGADRLLAVGVSASTPGREQQLADVVAAVRKETDVPVLVGGHAVDEQLAAKVGADGWAPDAALAMTRLTELLATG